MLLGKIYLQEVVNISTKTNTKQIKILLRQSLKYNDKAFNLCINQYSCMANEDLKRNYIHNLDKLKKDC